MSESLQPLGLQHARFPCPSLFSGMLKRKSIEWVMPSNHLILCRPFLFLPSIFPSIRVFSNKGAKVPVAHENCDVAPGLGDMPGRSCLVESFPGTHGQGWQVTPPRLRVPVLQGPREPIGAWEQARGPFPALPGLARIRPTGYI